MDNKIGINIHSSIVCSNSVATDIRRIAANTGTGKILPGEPTCTFRGKELEVLVAINSKKVNSVSNFSQSPEKTG